MVFLALTDIWDEKVYKPLSHFKHNKQLLKNIMAGRAVYPGGNVDHELPAMLLFSNQ